MTAPLRVAIIGASRRSSYMYLPLLRALRDEVELVGVWARTGESALRLGAEAGVPGYTDMGKMMRDVAPQIGIVSVAYAANGSVGLQAVEHGLHVLLETPIAHELSEADAIIAGAAARGLKIEVAEQYHRYPREQIKLALIASGVFGRVYSAFNDFCCHGYHGVSVMRSYLGFDVKPVQVTGAVHNYPLAPHRSWLSGKREGRSEEQEHGIVEFEGDRLGMFHWTSLGYDCPLRWWQSSRFLAEKGMGITVSRGDERQDWLTLLSPDGEVPHFMAIERRRSSLGGGILEAMIARTGDADIPVVRWENPMASFQRRAGVQWTDDQIAVASCLMSLVNAVCTGGEPSYGPLQARLDQELILALRKSAQCGGQPVRLPLDPGEPAL